MKRALWLLVRLLLVAIVAILTAWAIGNLA